MFYSTAQEVVEYTGVRPEDVGVSTSEELDTILEKWLVEIKDIIDAHRRRDFLAEAEGVAEDVRPLVHNVARRMASNMVALAVLRRDTPIIQIDDFSVKLVEDQVLTDDIAQDLRLIPARRTSEGSFRFWRVRSVRQVEEAEG